MASRKLLMITAPGAALIASLACGGAAATPIPASATPAAQAAAPTAAQSGPVDVWTITRGGAEVDQGWAVDADGEGSIYFATSETAAGAFMDIYLTCLTPGGEEIWRSHWGSSRVDQAYEVHVHDPYVYVGGRTVESLRLDTSDMILLAFNMADGSLAWEFTWDQGYGYEEIDGIIAEDDAIFIAGWTTAENNLLDIALLRLTPDGEMVWVQTWGSNGWDEENGQIVVTADRIYLAGRYDAQNAVFGGDAVLAAFEKTTGEYLWHTTWGGPQMDDALGMASDGEALYMVGITANYGQNGQVFLLKYDLDGSLLWEQVWGGPQGESARTLEIADGEVLVGVNTLSYGAGGEDIALVRFDAADGSPLGYQTWGGPENDGPLGSVVSGDVLYLAGNTRSFSQGDTDALLLRIDLAGRVLPPTP
jgi:hypothetical protein